MPKYYYLVLGISRGADLDKIKRAHRRVVKKHHPDCFRVAGGRGEVPRDQGSLRDLG